MSDPCIFRFRWDTNGPECLLRGKAARTLFELWVAREKGCTTKGVARWANDFAHYIGRLRRRGFDIGTELERNGAGWHGRYRLATPIVHIAYSDQGESGFEDLLEKCDLDGHQDT